MKEKKERKKKTSCCTYICVDPNSFVLIRRKRRGVFLGLETVGDSFLLLSFFLANVAGPLAG